MKREEKHVLQSPSAAGTENSRLYSHAKAMNLTLPAKTILKLRRGEQVLVLSITDYFIVIIIIHIPG